MAEIFNFTEEEEKKLKELTEKKALYEKTQKEKKLRELKKEVRADFGCSYDDLRRYMKIGQTIENVVREKETGYICNDFAELEKYVRQYVIQFAKLRKKSPSGEDRSPRRSAPRVGALDALSSVNPTV